MSDGSNRDLTLAQSMLLLAITITLALDDNFVVGPRYLIAALEVLLIFGIAIAEPLKHSLGTRIRRNFAILLIALISFVNIGSMALVIDHLINDSAGGKDVIFSAFAIFITNIIVFSIWYWEIDRPALSGKKWRDSSPHFLFPQEMEGGRKYLKKWRPGYFDYLYISITNSTAFSPTDAMPLTREAKALMGIQALVALLTVVLVTARAVTTLG